MACLRLIWAFDAIGIELPHGNSSHPNVPDVTGPMTNRIQIDDPGRRRIVRMRVELQANTRRVAAEQNKIDAVSHVMGTADRERTSDLNLILLRRCRETAGQIRLRH